MGKKKCAMGCGLELSVTNIARNEKGNIIYKNGKGICRSCYKEKEKKESGSIIASG